MGKYTTTLLLFIFATANAFSQSNLWVRNLQVVRHGDQVEVSFESTGVVHPPEINTTYIFTPYIFKGDQRIPLLTVMFGSRRSKILNERRHVATDNMYRLGETVYYRQRTPYQEWMADATLAVEEVYKGCCRTQAPRFNVLMDHILPAAVVEELPIEPEPMPAPVEIPSAGRQMAQKYAFVASQSEQDDQNGATMPDFAAPLVRGMASTVAEQQKIDRYLSQHDQGALEIFFEQSQATLNPDFSGNGESMRKLMEVINAIGNSDDSRISRIVIAGFASPEGLLGFNEQLAWERALSIQKFLTDNTQVDPKQICLYNGGENWTRLRKLVEGGDMAYKDQVLAIIDNVPLLKGREKQLMDLRGGNPFRYMMEHYFPQLRHAAYIKIYYLDDSTQTDIH